MERFTKLTKTMATSGAVLALTATMGWAGCLDMQTDMTAAIDTDKTTAVVLATVNEGGLIVDEDGAQLATMVILAANADVTEDGMTKVDDNYLAAGIDPIILLESSTDLGDTDSALTVATMDARPSAEAGDDMGDVMILATETSQQLPAGVGDPLLVNAVVDAESAPLSDATFLTVAALTTELPVPDAADQPRMVDLAALTDLDITPWTASGFYGASSS